MDRIMQAKPIHGMLGLDAISRNLPTRTVRRLKRFSRLALSLAADAYAVSGLEQPPESVFMGTGWGHFPRPMTFLKN